MGFIRGLLLLAVSTIFILAIFSAGILFTISSSLKLSVVEVQAVNAVQSWGINFTSALDANQGMIQSACSGSSDYVFNFQGYTFHFSCQDASNNTQIMNDIIKNFISDSYYTQYNCNYWDCFGKYNPPFFLISDKSYSYWTNLLYFSLIAVILSAVLSFFLYQKKPAMFFTSGGIFIASATLIYGLGKLDFLPKQISSLAMLFFSQSFHVFIWMLIIGAALVLVGLILELIRVEFKIYNIFSKVEKIGEQKVKPQVKNKSKK